MAEIAEQSALEPNRFYRPDTNVIFRLTNRLLPPAPIDHIALGYGDLRRQFRLWHYVLGIPMLIIFFAITSVEIRLIPELSLSPITIVGFGLTGLWLKFHWLLLLLVIPLWAYWTSTVRWRRERRQNRPQRQTIQLTSVGILNSMAVVEEQWFREGAELWTRRQRFMSCFAFGFAHMANLFYSFSTILPLALGGYLFMRVYLHAYNKTGGRTISILEAALVHRVYNRVALISVGLSLGYSLLALVFHLPALIF